MDYCKGGVGGLSVSLSLMRRTQWGVSPATQTMMVNMWRIKKSWDIFVVLWGNQEVEDNFVPVLTFVSKCVDPGRGLTRALVQTCTLLCCVPASSPSFPLPRLSRRRSRMSENKLFAIFRGDIIFQKRVAVGNGANAWWGGEGGEWALTQT